jgi:hypothetical protein
MISRDIFDVIVLNECLEDSLPTYSTWELETSLNIKRPPSRLKLRVTAGIISECVSMIG